MVIGTNRKEQLRDLYIKESKDLLYIANILKFASPKEVADELKELNIPLRVNDEAKTTHQFDKRNVKDQKITGYKFIDKTSVIYSEHLDIRNYLKAQIFFEIIQFGTPSNTNVDIEFEVSYRNMPNKWYKINDTAVASISIAEGSFPVVYGYTIDDLGGDRFRVKLSISGAGTLTIAQGYTISNLIGSFFGH